jgi:heparanase 1
MAGADNDENNDTTTTNNAPRPPRPATMEIPCRSQRRPVADRVGRRSRRREISLSSFVLFLFAHWHLGNLVALHRYASNYFVVDDDGGGGGGGGDGRRRRDDDVDSSRHPPDVGTVDDAFDASSAMDVRVGGNSSSHATTEMEDVGVPRDGGTGVAIVVAAPLTTVVDGDIEHLHMELRISPSSATCLGMVDPEYVSATLDWWPLGTESWGNASVINADLRHPTLLAAAGGLRPFYLRVGGSQADEVLYHMNDDDDDDDVGEECRRHPQRCLTRNRWDDVLDFARDVGARLVFTIAYVRHTREYDDDDGGGGGGRTNDVRDWSSTNARRLLEYTRSNTEHASRGTVYGFELGNELRHKGKIRNVTRIVAAYRELGRLVDDVWDDDRLPRPRILGPASTGGKESSSLISEIGPHIDVATYHKYHGGGKDPSMHRRARHPSFYVHPMKVSGPGEAVRRYVVGRRRRRRRRRSNDDGEDDGGGAGMSSRLWIGEGAMAYNSGLPGVSDSFRGSLWFANLLGALAKTKPLSHGVYCRQSLLGGHYELISHETMVPNPDYWVAYLWKNLVGTKAVGPIISPGRRDSPELSSYYTFGCCEKPGMDTVLIHSFCAKSNNNSGDVVFVVINISKSRGINLNITMGLNRTEYNLQPESAKEGMRSRGVSLNGRAMSIGSDGSLPNVHKRGVARVRGDLTHVPPISIAFVVVHGADVEECSVEP